MTLGPKNRQQWSGERFRHRVRSGGDIGSHLRYRRSGQAARYRCNERQLFRPRHSSRRVLRALCSNCRIFHRHTPTYRSARWGHSGTRDACVFHHIPCGPTARRGASAMRLLWLVESTTDFFDRHCAQYRPHGPCRRQPVGRPTISGVTRRSHRGPHGCWSWRGRIATGR